MLGSSFFTNAVHLSIKIKIIKIVIEDSIYSKQLCKHANTISEIMCQTTYKKLLHFLFSQLFKTKRIQKIVIYNKMQWIVEIGRFVLFNFFLVNSLNSFKYISLSHCSLLNIIIFWIFS